MNEPEKKVHFTPLIDLATVENHGYDPSKLSYGDRRDGLLYRYTDQIKLAVNVAYATGRPLLVLGPSGSGKSSLAFNLARKLGRKYYEFVVTSRTQAKDLCYRFDAVRRLGDTRSQSAPADPARTNESYYPYLEPGPLWWIIKSKDAVTRGSGNQQHKAIDTCRWKPESEPEDIQSVLLIDEIDKAEPDFPNNLLVPIGSWQFRVDEIEHDVFLESQSQKYDPAQHPLIIITSNRERELPETFHRRCIVLEMDALGEEDLIQIATETFEENLQQVSNVNLELYAKVANKMVEAAGSKGVSVAEYIDAIRAIRELGIKEADYLNIILKTSAVPGR